MGPVLPAAPSPRVSCPGTRRSPGCGPSRRGWEWSPLALHFLVWTISHPRLLLLSRHLAGAPSLPVQPQTRSHGPRSAPGAPGLLPSFTTSSNLGARAGSLPQGDLRLPFLTKLLVFPGTSVGHDPQNSSAGLGARAFSFTLKKQ